MIRVTGTIVVIVALVFSAWIYPTIWISIIACVLPSLIIALINGERINILSGRKLGIMTATKGNSLALLGTFFIPGRLTEILKPFYFLMKRQFPLSAGISVVVVERIFDAVALACLALVAVNLIDIPSQTFSDATTHLTILMLVLLVLVFLIVFKFPSVIENLIRWLPFETLNRFLESSFVSFRQGLSFGFSYWSIILTVVVWTGSVGLYWLFLQLDGGAPLTINQTLIVFLVGTFGIAITFTPGGIGTFEAAVALILQQFGYSFESALTSAIGLRLVVFFPNAMIASYAIIFEGFSFVKVKKYVSEIRGE